MGRLDLPTEGVSEGKQDPKQPVSIVGGSDHSQVVYLSDIFR